MLSVLTSLTLDALLMHLGANWQLKASFMFLAVFLMLIVGVSQVNA